MRARIFVGDALERSRQMPDESVQCVVTSPPYWSLRVYGGDTERGIGGEKTPEEYASRLASVFVEVRRVLKNDGTLFLNLGDSYAASGKGGGGIVGAKRKAGCWENLTERTGFRMPPPGYKMKDLTLSPFQVADALRRSGWYLRSVIIWQKTSAVEPMRLDRPAVSHEYVFLLAKSEIYTACRSDEKWWGHTVWKITSESREGHPAAMPDELARRGILMCSRPGDLVMDPFCGSGTTGVVALRYHRDFLGIELTPEYSSVAAARLRTESPMFNEVEVIP